MPFTMDKEAQRDYFSSSNRSRGGTRVRRNLIVALATFILFSWLGYRLSSSVSTHRQPIPNVEEEQSTRPSAWLDPHLKKGDLGLVLNRTDSDIPSVRVTITNYHHSTKVSLLMWSSPFDPQAVATGMFKVIDRSNGREVHSAGLKMTHLLAPKQDDFVELLPRHAVTKDVSLDDPDISLEPGKSYDVQVRSSWKAVWHANAKTAGEGLLKRTGGPTGLINWDYDSNVFRLDVPRKR